jgi:hypothetical protein
MDQSAIDTLHSAGMDLTLTVTDTMPILPVKLDGDGNLVPVGDEVAVLSDGKTALVKLKSIPALFTGDRRPPDFTGGPTDEYLFFFAMIERTAADCCTVTGRVEKDAELERLFRLLRKRPDGKDANPVFSYLQAAARLYLSLRDGSAAEFDAVVARLARSAGRYADGPSSTNYFRLLHEHFTRNAR